MLFFVLFIAEIVLLFIFARALTNNLARLLFKISHSRGFTFNTLAIIFLPGTIIHEISHMLIAGIMLVPSGDISIFPEIEGDEVRFGSVKIAQTDPIRRFIIGVAPVLFGLFLILAVLFLGGQFLNQQTPWWQIALVVLLVFEIANTMFSSKKDMEGALVFFGIIFIILSAVFGTLYFSNSLTSFLIWVSTINLPGFVEFFRKSSLLLLIPLGVNLVLITIAKLLKA